MSLRRLTATEIRRALSATTSAQAIASAAATTATTQAGISTGQAGASGTSATNAATSASDANTAKAAALAAQIATEALQGLLTTLATGQGKPYANAYAAALPRGVTSVTIGGTAITGATVGEYAITGSGGSITGYSLTLVVTSATTATVRVDQRGLGSGTTPPTLTKPAGANLPAGTTLTAVLSPLIAVGESYAVAMTDSSGVTIYTNNGTSTPATVNNPDGSAIAFMNAREITKFVARFSPYGNTSYITSNPLWLRIRPNIIMLDGSAPPAMYVWDGRRDLTTRANVTLKAVTGDAIMVGLTTSGSSINPQSQAGHNGGVGQVEVVPWFSATAIAAGIDTANSTIFIDYGSGDLWSAGGTFQAGTTANTYLLAANMGLSTAQKGDARNLAGTVAKDIIRRAGVFASTVTDTKLLDWITSVVVEGREATDLVEITQWEKISNRCQFFITDVRTGAQIAQGGFTAASGSLDYSTITTIKLREGTAGPAGFTGRFITLKFDTSRTPATTTLTTLASGAGRFVASAVKSMEDQLVEFRRQRHARRSYFSTTWANMDAAVRATHATQQLFTNNEGFASSVSSNESNSHNRIQLFRETRGGRVIVPRLEGLLAGAPSTVGSITLPEFVDLHLNGGELYSSDNARVLEQNFSGSLRDGVIFCDPPAITPPDVTNYARHSDAPGGRTKVPLVGDTRFQQQCVMQHSEDMKFIGGTNHRNWLDAVGLQSGSIYTYRRCGAERRNPTNGQSAFGMHNSPSMTEPAIIEHVGTYGDQHRGALMEVGTGFNQAASGRNRLLLDGCDPFDVRLICSMALASAENPDLWYYRWSTDVYGDHEGCINHEDPNALALKLPDNVAYSGTAIDVLFGTVDEYGYGARLILDGTTVALRGMAARLNGLGAKTLTVAGVTHTFNVTDPNIAATTLIAAANATLGANVLQLARMDKVTTPRQSNKRRVFPVTGGVTITPGTALKRLGNHTVRICGVAEYPDGFALTPIIGGAAATGGIMDCAAVVPAHHFDEVAGLTEQIVNVPFGINGSGRIDLSATLKVGWVSGWLGGAGQVRWMR